MSSDRSDRLHLVGACGCTHIGCGCTACRIVWDGATVEFCDFRYFDPQGLGASRRFRFTLANYMAVLAAMRRLAHAANQQTGDELDAWVGK